MNQITVSIYVPTYNHENYIVQALDSILMQRTQYSYEVFVGEDCSTDGTRQVLQQWEATHPDPRFHIYYRQENMGGSGRGNVQDLKDRCKGKYIICLEGDDFWTDPTKLEQQVSFLETHPEYYAVAHNCIVVGEDGQPNGETYPECKDTEYIFRHFANDILPGQAATFLCRNYMLDPDFDRSLITKRAGPADRNLYFSVLCRGSIYCMQQTLSAYRHITTSGTSFSATHRFRYEVEELANRSRMEYAYQTQTVAAIPCTEYLYLRCIRYALRIKHISIKQALTDIKNIQHKCRAFTMLLRRDIKKVFHCKDL